MKSTTGVNPHKEEPELLRPPRAKSTGGEEETLFRYAGSKRKTMKRSYPRAVWYGAAAGLAVVLGLGVLAVKGSVSGDDSRQEQSEQDGRSAAPSTERASAKGGGVPLNPDAEVRFGMAAPFTGPSKELGRQMSLGLQSAFAKANDAGGVAGRKVTLVTADDGYEPMRTATAVSKLRDTDQVMGYVGNVGTPTAAVSLPYALKNRMLFFGAFTGAESLRTTPPDRYVFNYRPSYAEETEAAVNYLVRVRGVRPNEIAVFAQEDGFGDSGYDGVAKAMRVLYPAAANAILRMNYTRNNLNLKSALQALHSHRGRISAIVMIASYRPAAKFIESVRPNNPDIIFTNVSFVGSSSLADELKLLGPKYMNDVMVTQTVPSISGSSDIALDYKSTLEKYFPGESPDYVSFEGYVDGKILLEALRRAGKNLSTERLVSSLENLRDVDLGLGAPVSLSPYEHQASHRIWGTVLTPEATYKAIDLK